MQFTTILFDLDDTLYPASSGLWALIRKRIIQYMHERLHMSWDEIPALREQLFQQYGTTLRGLQATRDIDTADFLAYVHDVPVADYLRPAPELRRILLGLPYRRLIFTNADRNHAWRVLQALQLEGCFEQIIDILDVAPYCKPQPEAFQVALQRSGETNAAACIYLDDSPRNLAVARRLGLFTIRVGGDGASPDYHASIPDLTSLPKVLHRLGAVSNEE